MFRQAIRSITPMKVSLVIAFLSTFAIGQALSPRDQAWELASQGKFDQAASLYEKVVASSPQDSTSVANLGWCYLELKRYQDAVNLSQKAIALDRENSYAYNNLGYSLTML